MENDWAVDDKKVGWPWMSWFSSIVLISTALGFLLLSLRMPLKEPLTWSWPTASWFWPFVVLPGIIGIANYFIVSRQRSTESPIIEEEKKVAALAMARAEFEHRPKPREAVAAAILLTGVLSIVARASSSEYASDLALDGVRYAGYGVYISTLWFMLVRLNANALSPRFVLNSGVKAAVAIVIGYVAVNSMLFDSTATVKSMKAVYFLIGLFHSWAINALRKKAMTMFGVVETRAADLPVRLLEGVDDGAVDVLEELGITSVQHLATMHAPEVCGRSLYPRYRVLDWIDQSILVMHTNGRINELRALGIRSAYALITVAQYANTVCKTPGNKTLQKDAEERFKEIAQRLGLSNGGLYLLTQCIRNDPAYDVLEKAYPERHPLNPVSSGPAEDAPIGEHGDPGLHEVPA